MEVECEVTLLVGCPECGCSFEVTQIVSVEVDPDDVREDLD